MNAVTFWEALDRLGFETLRVLLSVLWQSSILLAAVMLIAFALRRRRASARHALWVAALLVAPALPLLGWAASRAGTPQAQIPVMPAYSAPEVEFSPTPPVSSAPTPVPPVEPPIAQEQPQRSLLDYPWGLAFLAYVFGAGAFLSLVTLGRTRLWAWVRRGREVEDARVAAAFQFAREHLGLARASMLMESERVLGPLTLGALRPVVLLPLGLAKTLSEQDLRAVAIHELAHVKRRDPIVLGLASLVRAVLFFHPLVWLACRQISNLAEAACDDAVLDATGEPVSYAKMLARLAEELPRRSLSTELSAGIMLSKSAFLRRVEAILSPRRVRIRKLSRLALAGTVFAILASTVLSCILPLGQRTQTPGGEAALRERAAALARHLSLQSRHGGPEARVVQELVSAGQETIYALEAFCEAYKLAPDENLKLIAPPYMPERLVYYEWSNPGQAEAIPRGPDVMCFRWEEPSLRPLGMGFGKTTLMALLRPVFGLGRQDVEGTRDILERPLKVDVVYRDGVPSEKLLEGLQAALRQELGWQIRLAFREVERNVAVASGIYKHSSLPEYKGLHSLDSVEIYGSERRKDPHMGPGGSGDIHEFLHWVGSSIGRPVVGGEVVGAPERLSWFEGPRLLDAERQTVFPLPQDQVDLVLKHITEQTGLTFTEEVRNVRILFVEEDKPEGAEEHKERTGSESLSSVPGIRPAEGDGKVGQAGAAGEAGNRAKDEATVKGAVKEFWEAAAARDIDRLARASPMVRLLAVKPQATPEKLLSQLEGQKESSEGKGTDLASIVRVDIDNEVGDALAFAVEPADGRNGPWYYLRKDKDAWLIYIFENWDTPTVQELFARCREAMPKLTDEDALAKAADAKAKSDMLTNLHQLGLAFAMYAADHAGEWPADVETLEKLGYLGEGKTIKSLAYEGATLRYVGPQVKDLMEVVVYYWPPLKGGVAALFRDTHAEWIPLQQDGSLVNPYTSTVIEPPQTAKSTFGPVIERVLNDDDEKTDIFIDFDTGKLTSRPEFQPKGWDEVLAWIRGEGIDAMCALNPEVWTVSGLDMAVAPVPARRWDVMSAGDVRQAFTWVEPGSVAFMDAKGDLPLTYVFKTREGGMGILQILEVRQTAPRGVKVRYKMVQQPAQPEAKAGEPAGGEAQEGIERRVYDIRDLCSYALSQEARAERSRRTQEAVKSGEAVGGGADGTVVGVRQSPEEEQRRLEEYRKAAEKIARFLIDDVFHSGKFSPDSLPVAEGELPPEDLPSISLMAGVPWDLIVLATPEQHQRMEGILNDMRQGHALEVNIEVHAYVVKRGQVPSGEEKFRKSCESLLGVSADGLEVHAAGGRLIAVGEPLPGRGSPYVQALSESAMWESGNPNVTIASGQTFVIEKAFKGTKFTSTVPEDRKGAFVSLVVSAAQDDALEAYRVSQFVPDRRMLVVVDERPLAGAAASIWAGEEQAKKLDLEDCAVVLMLRPTVVIVMEEEVQPAKQE